MGMAAGNAPVPGERDTLLPSSGFFIGLISFETDQIPGILPMGSKPSANSTYRTGTFLWGIAVLFMQEPFHIRKIRKIYAIQLAENRKKSYHKYGVVFAVPRDSTHQGETVLSWVGFLPFSLVSLLACSVALPEYPTG